jgi:tRNA(Ile2) C34 agmatinyltransferase TiaS
MNEATIENLASQLENNPDFIVGRYSDTNTAIEVFVRNPTLPVSQVLKDLKTLGLNVLKAENKRFTILVSLWKEHDCRRCGGQLNSVENNGEIKYFCPQCVEFK